MKKKHYSFMLAIGLFIMAGSMILNHFYPMSDFPRGISMGIGLGVMLLSFYRRRTATV